MKNKNSKLLMIIGGTLTGFINGFFGGGGGMVAVPYLTKVMKREPKKAHATAILIILPVTIVSSINYLARGDMNEKHLIPVIIGVVLGGIIGAKLLNRISDKYITLIFGAIMVIAGIKMVI